MTIRSTRGAVLLAVVVLGVSALTPLTASAELITFTHTGLSGSGSIAGDPFSARAFAFTSTGDTVNRQSFGGGFFIDHDSASISIDGVGEFTFVTATRTFFNDGGDIVGFSRAGISGLDLYNGPADAALNGWDMLTSIGPINGSTSLLQWAGPPVITSGGQLVFSNAATTGSFRAEVGPPIPEPSTLTLLGVAGLLTATGTAVRRRRRE